MLCYRNLSQRKFNRDINVQLTFQVESWLNYHGEKLEKGFNCPLKMMNQLLKTIDITRNHVIRITYSKVEANIYIVGINSDFFHGKGK
jgi:homoserine acetyltransferase